LKNAHHFSTCKNESSRFGVTQADDGSAETFWIIPEQEM
jgi:hypothetical protein